MRERIEFGLFGDMAAVTFDNGENVQIGQNVVQEKFDQDEEKFDCKRKLEIGIVQIIFNS